MSLNWRGYQTGCQRRQLMLPIADVLFRRASCDVADTAWVATVASWSGCSRHDRDVAGYAV